MNAYLTEPLLEDACGKPWRPGCRPKAAPQEPAPQTPAAAAIPADTQTQRPPFDARVHEERLAPFDPPSLRTLLSHFIRHCNRRIAMIQATAEVQDCATTRREAQDLKGAARAEATQAIPQQLSALIAAVHDGLGQLRGMQTLRGSPPGPGSHCGLELGGPRGLCCEHFYPPASWSAHEGFAS